MARDLIFPTAGGDRWLDYFWESRGAASGSWSSVDAGTSTYRDDHRRYSGCTSGDVSQPGSAFAGGERLREQ